MQLLLVCNIKIIQNRAKLIFLSFSIYLEILGLFNDIKQVHYYLYCTLLVFVLYQATVSLKAGVESSNLLSDTV